ncbi:hypothetical protein EDB19DRAFT_1831278 [Suillus lakei]|nr:hypothetical protein EDB19DRAFT_1831278 [Suillus lakei]
MTVSESSFPSPPQASSSLADPPQSCSPSPVSYSSETLINSSPISSLSITQASAEPPGLKETLMFIPGKLFTPTDTTYFSPEAMQKFEEQLENGLLQMKTATLYKGYKGKLLSHKVACQHLFLSTLEAEEANLTATYTDSICAENQEHFGFAEEELQHYRMHFSQCGCLEADDNRDYLQAVYEDECQILCTVSIQTDQVTKILDKHITQSLTNCTGYFTMHCCFHNGVQTTEPFTHEDSDITSDGSDDVEDGSLGLLEVGSNE